MNWGAFYYGLARTGSVGKHDVFISLILLILSIAIIVCEMKKPDTDGVIISLVVALIGVFILRTMSRYWGTTLSYYDFNSMYPMYRWKTMLFIFLSTLTAVATLVLTGTLWIKSFFLVFSRKDADSHKKQKEIIEFILVLLFSMILMFTESTVFTFLNRHIGQSSSIPSTFYKIRTHPNRKSKLMEDLMCNMIPIQGNGQSNTMTRQARSLFLRQWEDTFGRPLTTRAYEERFSRKQCPLRSESMGRLYPRMPS